MEPGSSPRFLSPARGGQHAAAVTDLAPLHKAPFDRMLVAQALCEPTILLTNDAVLAGYGPFVTVA
jgi:PIN domain nuclease of toxin-antitoxin system